MFELGAILCVRYKVHRFIPFSLTNCLFVCHSPCNSIAIVVYLKTCCAMYLSRPGSIMLDYKIKKKNSPVSMK